MNNKQTLELLNRMTEAVSTQHHNCFTIQKTLLFLNLTTKDIKFLKINEPKIHEQLKATLLFKIAHLYENAIAKPRQLTPMLKLIELQDKKMAQLFPEETANSYINPIISINNNSLSPNRIDPKLINKTNKQPTINTTIPANTKKPARVLIE